MMIEPKQNEIEKNLSLKFIQKSNETKNDRNRIK